MAAHHPNMVANTASGATRESEDTMEDPASIHNVYYMYPVGPVECRGSGPMVAPWLAVAPR